MNKFLLIPIFFFALLLFVPFMLSVPSSGGGTTVDANLGFLDLNDTPNSYAGQAGNSVRVNVGQSGLEFYTPASVASSDRNVVGASGGDKNADFLNGKLQAGSGITLTLQNAGGDENILISATGSGTDTNCSNNASCILTGKITTTQDANMGNIKFNGTISGGDFNQSILDHNDTFSCPAGQAVQTIGLSSTCITFPTGTGRTYTSGTPATIEVNNDTNTISQNFDGNFSSRFRTAFDTNFRFSFDSNFLRSFDGNFQLRFDGNFNTRFPVSFDSNFNTKFPASFDSNFNIKFKPAFDSNFMRAFDANFSRSFDSNFTKSFDSNFLRSFDSNFNRSFDGNFQMKFDGNFQRAFDANYYPRNALLFPVPDANVSNDLTIDTNKAARFKDVDIDGNLNIDANAISYGSFIFQNLQDKNAIMVLNKQGKRVFTIDENGNMQIDGNVFAQDANTFVGEIGSNKIFYNGASFQCTPQDQQCTKLEVNQWVWSVMNGTVAGGFFVTPERVFQFCQLVFAAGGPDCAYKIFLSSTGHGGWFYKPIADANPAISAIGNYAGIQYVYNTQNDHDQNQFRVFRNGAFVSLFANQMLGTPNDSINDANWDGDVNHLGSNTFLNDVTINGPLYHSVEEADAMLSLDTCYNNNTGRDIMVYGSFHIQVKSALDVAYVSLQTSTGSTSCSSPNTVQNTGIISYGGAATHDEYDTYSFIVNNGDDYLLTSNLAGSGFIAVDTTRGYYP